MQYRGDLRAFLRERMAPLALWLVAVGVAVWLWTGVTPGGAVTGVAARDEVGVSPLRTGRLATVLVATGDRVAAGQIVATLDPSPIEHDLRVLEAERAEVEAELQKAQADARRAGVTSVQDKDSAVAAAERDLQAARASLDTRRAELKAIDRELRRRRDLVDEQLLDNQALSDLIVKRTPLAEEVAEARQTVALLERQAAAAGARETLDPSEYVDKAVAPLEARLKVLDSRLLLTRAERDDLVLRAPVAGEVIALERHPGEVAEAAVPIARIVADNPGRVIACLPEDTGPAVRVGDVADLAPHHARDTLRRGTAVAVGPVGQLPERCWREPRTPLWGRTVQIQLDPSVTLVPGTAFDVRFSHRAEEAPGGGPSQGGPG